MFGKKKETNNNKEVVVVSTHNKNVDMKIEDQLAKQKKIVVADNLMLVLWIATIVLFALNQYLFGFVTFGCLAFCTFNTSTAKKLRNEYALLAVCILSFICVPFILLIDIFKLARINSKIKSLEKDKLPEEKPNNDSDAVSDNKDDNTGVTDSTTSSGEGEGSALTQAPIKQDYSNVGDVELDIF